MDLHPETTHELGLKNARNGCMSDVPLIVTCSRSSCAVWYHATSEGTTGMKNKKKVYYGNGTKASGKDMWKNLGLVKKERSDVWDLFRWEWKVPPCQIHKSL